MWCTHAGLFHATDTQYRSLVHNECPKSPYYLPALLFPTRVYYIVFTKYGLGNEQLWIRPEKIWPLEVRRHVFCCLSLKCIWTTASSGQHPSSIKGIILFSFILYIIFQKRLAQDISCCLSMDLTILSLNVISSILLPCYVHAINSLFPSFIYHVNLCVRCDVEPTIVTVQ